MQVFIGKRRGIRSNQEEGADRYEFLRRWWVGGGRKWVIRERLVDCLRNSIVRVEAYTNLKANSQLANMKLFTIDGSDWVAIGDAA